MRPPLTAVLNLFNDLNQQNIIYCHWKSNQHLTEALNGSTDLDILVARDQEEDFRVIVHQHGCKLIISPPGKQYPGLEDYLGYDPETGHSFHLHVHYQLILGEQFVKNYRLPLTEQFLAATTISQGIKIVKPTLELIVLVIRALLKYRDRDALKDYLSVRSGGLPRNILREFEYLLQQTSIEAVETYLNQHGSLVSPDIIRTFLQIITTNPRQGAKLYQLRQQVRRKLTPFQRYSNFEAKRQYFTALWCRQVPGWCKQLAKKKLAGGGISFAFIGADGAGKSTTLKTVSDWLSWKLDKNQVYMGIGEKLPRINRLLHYKVQLTARFWRGSKRLFGEQSPLTKPLEAVHHLITDVFHVSLGKMRYNRYLASQRDLAQGSIIIYDRYPLQAIHAAMPVTLPPMDGPRIAWRRQQEDKPLRGLTAYLASLEESFYQKILPPDYLIILHVPAEVSHQRKPDHLLEEIRPKVEAIETMKREGLHIIDIDTTQPLETVLLRVKQAIWDIL